MQSPTLPKRLLPFFMFAAGAITAALIIFTFNKKSVLSNAGVMLRDSTTPFIFIEPLLACDVGSTLESPSLAALKSTFTKRIQSATMGGSIVDASIYFRTLSTGEWTAINIDTNYAPASLMKVPILMAYLKQAESTPDLLAYKVTVTEDPAPNTEQEIAPANRVEVGETYTIEDLLQLMAAQSDNRALNILMRGVNIDILDEILDDLGVPIPDEQENYTINPRLYSRFFRILYNATYLNDAMSERALRILSQASFTEGLQAGVPSGVAVAHKFGEAATTLTSGAPAHELHDCGIVYAPQPYALCVMTKGANATALATFIADISDAAYTFSLHEK